VETRLNDGRAPRNETYSAHDSARRAASFSWNSASCAAEKSIAVIDRGRRRAMAMTLSPAEAIEIRSTSGPSFKPSLAISGSSQHWL
jgi:hypothetical protein